MANPEHVEIVKQGAKAIAAWREKNPDTLLELSGADLTRSKLSGADLSGADLSNAELVGAHLIDANLQSSDLRGADLSDAYLRLAKLIGADLGGARLSGAYLMRTNLSHADLRDVDVRGAYFLDTTLGNIDLATTNGLEEVKHLGPSIGAVDAYFASEGNIPDVFLRGCGVPEELIVQLPAIMASMQPIQFYSCFISYSSEDDAFARRLHARLKAEKLRVWFALEDMRGGKKSADQIDMAIRVHDRLLLLLSEKSMSSEWVRREIKRAWKKEKQSGKNALFPIALASFDAIRAWECLDADSGEDLAEKVREYHIPDFSQWKQEDAFGKAFGELMRDLREEAT